jgi:hypothetical protein
VSRRRTGRAKQRSSTRACSSFKLGVERGARRKRCATQSHPSAQKCAHFFEEAADDLDALERKSVSPNVIAASVVLFAWDWRIRERGPARVLLTQGRQQWAKRFKILYAAEGVLLELQPIAEQVDLIEPPLRRAEREQRGQKLNLDFTNVDTDGEGTDDDDEEDWRSEWWPGEGRLLARAVRTAGQLAGIREELKQAVRHLKHKGRPPEDKRNCLIALFAVLFRARTRVPRFERIARLLNAAALPGIGFDRNNVRQRFYALDDGLVRDIDWAVSRALRAASSRRRVHR